MSADFIVPARPSWAVAFSELTSGVISAAGGLADQIGCTVRVTAECDEAGLRCEFQISGTSDDTPLKRLAAEIDQLPTFVLPGGTVKIALGFRVRGAGQIPPLG